MRIVWSEIDTAFQAEFTLGVLWQSDQQAAKDAGFRTTGPPNWKWLTTKAAPLNKLRNNKPASGLVITEAALSHYQTINRKEQDKAALKKQFKDIQKKQSKEAALTDFVPAQVCEFGCLCTSRKDLTPAATRATVYKAPILDSTCMVCGDGLVLPFPDYPDVCLWCDGR